MAGAWSVWLWFAAPAGAVAASFQYQVGKRRFQLPIAVRWLFGYSAGMVSRLQFSLQGLLAWVSLLAVGLGLVRWLAIGQMPSGQFMFAALMGAIYGGAVLLLAKAE